MKTTLSINNSIQGRNGWNFGKKAAAEPIIGMFSRLGIYAKRRSGTSWTQQDACW